MTCRFCQYFHRFVIIGSNSAIWALPSAWHLWKFRSAAEIIFLADILHRNVD